MTQKISIQERMRNKALDAMDHVEFEIDKVMDNNKSSFSMYKYLRQLDYSGKVVQYMKGYTNEMMYELKNEEECEQLEEAYSFLSTSQKKYAIQFLEKIEKDIDKFVDEYKPIRKVKIKTPAQLVKRLPYQKRFAKYDSIDPVEIIRARMLFAYNTSSKKLTCFETHGGLSVKGSKIVDYNKCTEKTLTDLKLLDRLVSGGNVIASKFMDEIPRSKEKEGNNRITKNTLLVKVIR